MAEGHGPRRVLVLGGAGSGKSGFAERLAASYGRPVVYVATGEAGDDEMAERIRRHRARRPAGWLTVEERCNVTEALARTATLSATWLIDSVTLLVASAMTRAPEAGAPARAGDRAEATVLRELDGVFALAEARNAHVVLVSDEVGMGVVPDHPSGRRFRDLLGRANQHLSERCDEVYLVVAGLAIECKSRAVPWP